MKCWEFIVRPIPGENYNKIAAAPGIKLKGKMFGNNFRYIIDLGMNCFAQCLLDVEKKIKEDWKTRPPIIWHANIKMVPIKDNQGTIPKITTFPNKNRLNDYKRALVKINGDIPKNFPIEEIIFNNKCKPFGNSLIICNKQNLLDFLKNHDILPINVNKNNLQITADQREDVLNL